MLEALLFYRSTFNSVFFANAATFLFKLELFINLAMSDLSTNCFCLTHLDLMSNISAT